MVCAELIPEINHETMALLLLVVIKKNLAIRQVKLESVVCFHDILREPDSLTSIGSPIVIYSIIGRRNIEIEGY